MVTPSQPAIRQLHSPIGRIELIGDGETIISLTIERNGALAHDDTERTSDRLLERAAQQLEQYFAGTRKAFDLPVDLGGTPFQRAVWAQLALVPFGAVTSYGHIGRLTGRASAGRAVGAAIGANPVPILVPCHRVLSASNRITGYSAGNGIPTKQQLLCHESISYR